MDIDLAKRDELPEGLTTEQMNNAKAQFNPSSTVNVNVKPYTIYSPNEQVVGEWQEMRDGVLKKKPVYEKTCSETTNSTTGWQTFNVGFTTIEKIVSVNGNLYQSDGWVKSLGHSTNTDTLMFDIKPIDGRWEVYVASSTGQNSPVLLEIRYTKTTDQWETVE